jgi:hypothetical protein
MCKIQLATLPRQQFNELRAVESWDVSWRLPLWFPTSWATVPSDGVHRHQRVRL